MLFSTIVMFLCILLYTYNYLSACAFLASLASESSQSSESFELQENIANTGGTGVVPRIIWSYWHTADLPKVIQICMESWRIKNPNHSINMLNPSNLDVYLGENDLLQLSRSKDSQQMFSDIVRLEVMAKFGGVWMDASLLCNIPLDQIIRHDTPIVSQFIGYYNPAYTTQMKVPIVESWFFAAPPMSKFVMDWRQEFMKSNEFASAQLYIEDLQKRGIDLQNMRNPDYLAVYAAALAMIQNGQYYLSLLDAYGEEGPFYYLAVNNWDSAVSLQKLCDEPQKHQTAMVKLRKEERQMLDERPELLECLKTSFMLDHKRVES